MANGGHRNNEDFYKVLGLEKECTPIELKNAYKQLAKKWHPDRCSASGNSKFVEEAKTKFQAIQQAYSVLSDDTKRFLYDVGVYDNDDDENNHGMGDFLNEMVTMMSEHQPSENGEESFEQLQELFKDMFQRDSHDAFASTSQGMNPSCSSYAAPLEGSCTSNKRNSTQMKASEGSSSFNATYQSFSVGMECRGDSTKAKGTTVRTQVSGGRSGHNGASGSGSSRRYGRKQKVNSGHDVSSNGHYGISI